MSSHHPSLFTPSCTSTQRSPSGEAGETFGSLEGIDIDAAFGEEFVEENHSIEIKIPTHEFSPNLTSCLICGTESPCNQICPGLEFSVKEDTAPLAPVYENISEDEPGIAIPSTSVAMVGGTRATSRDGWLQRNDAKDDVDRSEEQLSRKRKAESLIQADIRKYSRSAPVMGIAGLRKRMVSKEGGGDEGEVSIVEVLPPCPPDIVLPVRTSESADREVWILRSTQRRSLASGESGRVETGIIIPARDPNIDHRQHAARVESASQSSHWLSPQISKNLLIRDGVVDGNRGGRVHVDVINTGSSRLIIAPGAVLGQFVREPFLAL